MQKSGLYNTVKNSSSNKFFKMILIIKVMNINIKINAKFDKYIIWTKLSKSCL